MSHIWTDAVKFQKQVRFSGDSPELSKVVTKTDEVGRALPQSERSNEITDVRGISVG
ncbi:MAG TPA: hypothetical protein VI893_10030 [Thermoplasmata archaeon]|nr:hypothetical protein [Thermoplasmata archaeon]